MISDIASQVLSQLRQRHVTLAALQRQTLVPLELSLTGAPGVPPPTDQALAHTVRVALAAGLARMPEARGVTPDLGENLP